MANDYIAPSSLMPSSMPMPGAVKWFVSGRERFGQDAAFFNSELRPNDGFSGNATLTIYLRLYLVQRDRAQDIIPRATTDSGADIDIVPWGSPTASGRAYDFAEFARSAKQQAEAFWDNTNFCLLPPTDYRGLDYPAGDQMLRPNIDCRFKIVSASGPQDAHAVIDCFCPTKPFIFRPFIRATDDGALGGQWSCYDLVASPGGNFIPNGKDCLVPQGDPLSSTTMTTVRCNKEIAHEAVCHETGHLLGLSHVGKFFKTPACIAEANTNDGACYRGPTDLDTENIMGGGQKFALWNIMPWASRATSHTGIGLQGWRASLRKIAPRRLDPV